MVAWIRISRNLYFGKFEIRQEMKFCIFILQAFLLISKKTFRKILCVCATEWYDRPRCYDLTGILA